MRKTKSVRLVKDKLKILLVDDHTLILDGLEQVLSDAPQVESILRAQSRTEMVEKLSKHFIDIILLDLNVHGHNMLDHLDAIRNIHPEIGIIILTSYDTQSFKTEAMAKNVNAYITKNASKKEIMYAIDEVAAGRFYLSHEASDQNNQFDKKDTFELTTLLTEREKDVLRLLAKGYTNSRISKELFISIHTIQSHRKNMFRKLDIHSVNELISFAFRNGLA